MKVMVEIPADAPPMARVVKLVLENAEGSPQALTIVLCALHTIVAWCLEDEAKHVADGIEPWIRETLALAGIDVDTLLAEVGKGGAPMKLLSHPSGNITLN